MSDRLTHINSSGKAQMVNVAGKPDMKRTAKASGFISLSNEAIDQIRKNLIKKGDVLTVAEIAGIMGGKKTSELIPLCHPLAISNIEVDLTLLENGIEAKSKAVCIGKTGIEMEALTAVSVALLTVYDMCKAVDKKMVISSIKLISKAKE